MYTIIYDSLKVIVLIIVSPIQQLLTHSIEAIKRV